jgi:hypothetical protein
MNITVIDGMGGGIGSQIIERLRQRGHRGWEIIALASNASAAQRMIEAGADRGASGENAVRVTVGQADCIVGPIGIVLPNSMMGEISPAMAEAVLAAPGKKFLLPLSQPHVSIVGLGQKSLADLLSELVASLEKADAPSD